MKWLQLIIALLFAFFAYVQLNDPDGMSWVLLYLIVAEVSAFAFMGKSNKTVTLAAMLLVGSVCLFHVPGLFQFLTNEDGIGFFDMIEWHAMMDQYRYIELTREFGGTLIATLALFAVWRSQ